MPDPAAKAPGSSPPSPRGAGAPAPWVDGCFGLWPENGPEVTFEEAQRALLERVLSFLPAPPAGVLVCGRGSTLAASLLAGSGRRVVASPALPETAAPGATAENDGRFAFDAVVSVDPEGIVPPGPLLRRSRELLREGGLVVLAVEVATGRGASVGGGSPTADAYTIALGEHGFRPIERLRVTAQIAPTCDAMVSRLIAASQTAKRAAASPPEQEALREDLERWARRRDAYAAGRLGYELIVARADPYTIGAYRDGDEDEILPMFREVFGVGRSLEHWYWKFRECPYGTRLIAETRSPQGELVAHFAGYPVPFYTSAGGGREFFAHQVGDTMTRASVRQAGLGKSGILARISSYYFARFCGDIPFVYGFNTGHVRKLGERYLGYIYVDPVGHWVRELGAGPLATESAWRRWLRGYSFGEVTEATPELDAFFARVKDDYGFLIRRDAEYVAWRYLRCPDRIHRVFALRHRGALAGWCVFARRGTALVWGDALVDRRHAAMVPSLLRWCIEADLYRGVDRVWGWFPPRPQWWAELLASAGFARVREPNDLTPCFVPFDGEELGRELADRWYYTYGDSDLF